MALAQDYRPVNGTEHGHPATHKVLTQTAGNQQVTATLIVRRRNSMPKMEEFSARSRGSRPLLTRVKFVDQHGADPKDLAEVEAFAKEHGLEVVASHAGRRSVVVRGTAAAMNKAFAVELHDYDSPRGKYHSHSGTANLPETLARTVEAVIGLDNRRVPAQHYSTARRQNPDDPPSTKALTPQQVAKLYDFPPGNGAGQTIGLYEMETGQGLAGYSMQDITGSMKAFGGGLKLPKIMDVPVDGVKNSGQSDGETGLDITVAGAVAQGAEIAVYFTGGEPQSILHALQQMIHPDKGAPEPSIISISYGWGPDDQNDESFSDQEYEQMSQLFQDAASLSVTVLVSSGDSGAYVYPSQTQAQTSYPASDPWVTACGGTTIGNVNGNTFTEYVWNDTGKAGHGATGGGVSARFDPPSYQSKAGVPKRLGSNKAGRGVPDLAGNASENSGYLQVIDGETPQAVGGTSAVAPLYAGLIARINANLGSQAGFLNPVLYAAKNVFHSISGPPGPANNSFGKVTGYPATAGWNPCTGLGSVNGTALENSLKTAVGVGE